MTESRAKAPARRTTTKRATRSKYDKASSRRIPPQVDPDKPSLRETATIVRRGTGVVKVNWQAADSAFKPITANQVVAVLTKLEIKDPKNCQQDADGNFFDAKGEQRYQYINAEWTIPEGEENQGRKIFGIWSLSPKALWRLKQDAVKLGVDPELFDYDDEDPESAEMDIEKDLLPAMSGCDAILDLTIEEYTTADGKKREKNVITDIQERTVGSRR